MKTKTMKMITFTVATLFSGVIIAQVNLGVQSTTKAATSVAANTTAITKATTAATTAANATVSSSINKTTDLKNKTVVVAENKVNHALGVTTAAKNDNNLPMEKQLVLEKAQMHLQIVLLI